MILASWNCAGAFRTKFRSLANLNADLCVVQECENPEVTAHDEYRKWATNHLWVGKRQSCGLGVFAKSELRIERLPLDAGGLELFLPCLINGSTVLLAVWTKQANSPTFQYIGQLWKYLEMHKPLLAKLPLLVVGDFNSNVRWDKWDRWWNHSDVVRELSALGAESAYHHVRSVPQGAEPEPTFYLQRNLKKAYHIDYAFIPRPWLAGCSVNIGAAAQWIEHSDHMPIIVSTNGRP